MRFADYVGANVTTLNFNLLFEIGFALGLNLPVIPIRDTTIISDKTDFGDCGGPQSLESGKDLAQTPSLLQGFAGAPPSPTRLNGAQKIGCA